MAAGIRATGAGRLGVGDPAAPLEPRRGAVLRPGVAPGVYQCCARSRCRGLCAAQDAQAAVAVQPQEGVGSRTETTIWSRAAGSPRRSR